MALLLGAMLIRRMKPVIVESEGAGGTASDVAQRLQSLSQEARENPEALATALSAWLGDTETSEDEQPPQATPGPNESTARAA